MKVTLRIPGEYTDAAAQQYVGKRLYAADGEAKREIGVITWAERHPHSVILEASLHDERDRLIAEMKAFTFGMGPLGSDAKP